MISPHPRPQPHPDADHHDEAGAAEFGTALARCLMDYGHEGVWMLGLDGTTCFVNARMAALLGYTREDLIGRCPADFMWPEDRPQGTTRSGPEQRYRRGDGTDLWTLASWYDLADDDGRPTGVAGLFTDITERRRRDADFEDRRQMMGVAMRAAKAGVWSWNARTNDIEWSDELYALYGLDRGVHVTFEQWESAVHPDDLERLRSFAADLRSNPADGRVEFRIRTPRGERWLLAIGQLEHDTRGEALRYIGMNLDITEQKLAEIRIRESEARYKALADSTPDGFAAFDRHLRYVFWNRAAEIMTGRGADQVLGKSREEIWGDTDAVRLTSAKLRECMQTGRPDSIELPILARGRSEIIDARMVPMPDGVATFLRDVTHQRMAEQELRRLYDQVREERNRQSLVLDNISEEVWFHDVDGRVVLVNRAAHDAFGDIEGRIITELAATLEVVRPDGSPRPADESPVIRALAGEEIRDVEEILKHPRSGELRTRSVTAIPARDPDGTVIGVVSVVKDVTARAAADRALAISRSRLDYATRLSGIGFWYCDLPFDELQWDDRVKEHFFFLPTARVTIEDFYARIHAEDREATRIAIAESIGSRAPYDMVYRTVDPATGAVKWIRALGGTDYAADGTPTHFDGVTVDVSAQTLDQHRLARLNAQLREQDRRKDEFIATLSHELRNPLAPIRTAAKIIASPAATPAQWQRAQLIIERQVTHMALLLDDLLDVARITRGKLQLRKARVALSDVVDAAVEAVRPTLTDKKHHLELSLPGEPLLLDADPLRLSQILSNLLMNAAKYSDPGGHIEVTARVDGDSDADGAAGRILSLSVKDAGIGIAPECIDGIFEIFSQIEPMPGRTDGGLGIGLALVKGLAELHGGSVQARSSGLGQGSEFLVRLPLAADLTTEPPQPATTRSRNSPAAAT